MSRAGWLMPLRRGEPRERARSAPSRTGGPITGQAGAAHGRRGRRDVAGTGSGRHQPVGARGRPVLDRYGQKTSVDWPGKVTSDAQLRGGRGRRQGVLRTRSTRRSGTLYGGDNGTQHPMKLSKTGYFHVQTVKGKSVLVDPQGNQFFSLGVNSFGSVGDTYTQVTGREKDFAWLPGKDDTGPFADGWRASDQNDYSFYLSNLVRKYGQSFDEQAWYAQQVSRVTKWGFNTAGGFSNLVAGGPKISYVAHLDDSPSYFDRQQRHPGHLPRRLRRELDTKMAAAVQQYKNDPYLIGYMFFNEINWAALRSQVTTSDGTRSRRSRCWSTSSRTSTARSTPSTRRGTSMPPASTSWCRCPSRPPPMPPSLTWTPSPSSSSTTSTSCTPPRSASTMTST